MSSTSGILDTTGTFPEDDMDDEMALAFAAEVDNSGSHSSSIVQNGMVTTQLSMGRFYGINHNHGLTDEFVGEFPHSALMESSLREVFRLRDFRPLQKQALNAAMLGHDSFVLMPTGGGKSLIYQLPAVLTQGVTFVISPLISLIRDQLFQLGRLGIKAATLSGDVTDAEVGAVYKDLASPSPRLKLLYVCPERLARSRSKMSDVMDYLYSKKLIARFVVDEAHCVAHWGHDFRPDYLKISHLRYKYKDVPMMALTATATIKIREEILKQLKMEVNTTKWFLCSFNRPNLRYEVIAEKAFKYSPSALCNLLQLRDYYDKCGIIYCLSQQECVDVAEALTRHGFSAAPYHAGLNTKLRSSTQDGWLTDKILIICATIAFGMGIDKPNVRFVIHNTLPKSLEGLYQEAGRAGRDGLPADCIVLYDYDDVSRVEYINDKSRKKDATPQSILHAKQLQETLLRVQSYCTNSKVCRRVQILKYFGEEFDPVNCGRNTGSLCDICKRQEKNRKRIKEEATANLNNIEPNNSSEVATGQVPAVGSSNNCSCNPVMPLHDLVQDVTSIQRKCLKELKACMEQQKDVNWIQLTTNLLEVLAVELPDTCSRLSVLAKIPLLSKQLEILFAIIKKYSRQKFELYQSYCGGFTPPEGMITQTLVLPADNNGKLDRNTKPGLRFLMPPVVPVAATAQENTNKCEDGLPSKKPKLDTTTIPATSNSAGSPKISKKAKVNLGMCNVVNFITTIDIDNIPQIMGAKSDDGMSAVVAAGATTHGSCQNAEQDATRCTLQDVKTNNDGNFQCIMDPRNVTNTPDVIPAVNSELKTNTNDTSNIVPAIQWSAVVPAIQSSALVPAIQSSALVPAIQSSALVSAIQTDEQINRETKISKASTDAVNVVPVADSNKNGRSTRSKKSKLNLSCPEPVPQVQTRRAIRKPKRYSS